MLQNKMWILLLIIGIALSCSQNEKKTIPSIGSAPSSFDLALVQSQELLLLIKNNLIIIDSTKVDALAVSHNLKLDGSTYRTGLNFGSIALNKVFKCKNNIITVVHYDFYYDSLNLDLKQDGKVILELLQSNFGQHSSFDSTSSMKTFTWRLAKNVLNYELFKNGFTFTLLKKELPLHLTLTGLLVDYVYKGSLRLESSTKLDVQNLFNISFKGRSNALAFSETYNENILLSGSFLFDGQKLSGAYFDYIYSDTITQGFVADAIIVKSIITELCGHPSDVATVPLSTSYRWGNSAIILDVYSNGFSILFEKDWL